LPKVRESRFGSLPATSSKVLPLLIGTTGAIRLRFLFLEKIDAALLPGIKRFGEESFMEVYGRKVQQVSWGKQRWFIFPALGALGSLVLLAYNILFPGSLTTL
jgi:hypothetical protein